MHYAKHTSKSAGLDDSSHDGSDRQYRIKAADLGFPVPDHILPDIIPISDPKLLYTNAFAQRDRRLRLLLRRYTNQIQFGCRNVNCTTPTCLSYRKRNSTGPLRRFTELSARTLACQLVEDFNRSGKEPSSGLCQNEPVVAWYEDPAASKKRRNSIEKMGGHHRQEAGHLQKIAVSSPRPRDSPKHGEHAPSAPGQDMVVQAGRRLRALEISKDDGVSAECISNILNSTLSQDDPGSTPPQDHTGDDWSDGSHHALPTLSKQKDIASFTQTLFDMVPLRLLNWLPSRNGVDKAEPTALNFDTEHNHQLQGPPQSATESSYHGTEIESERTWNLQESDLASQCRQVYALRTLSWNTLLWLRSRERSDDSYGYNRRLLPFIRQSLSYCLGDHERLVRTVQNLQDTYRPPRDKYTLEAAGVDIGDLPGATLQHEIFHERHSNLWPRVSTNTPEDMRALLFSLAFLGNFEERNLIMNSILSALQHSYGLPAWLQRRRNSKRSRSGSGSSEMALVKRWQGSEISNMPNLHPPDLLGLDALLQDERSLIPMKEVQITEVCLVALVSVAALVFDIRHRFWCSKAAFTRFARLRNSGLAHSRWPRIHGLEEPRQRALNFVRSMIEAIDVSEDWSVFRLLISIMDVISHRLTVSSWAATQKNTVLPKAKMKTIVDLLIDRFDRNSLDGWDELDENASWIGTATIELARMIMLKQWDRQPIIQRSGPVGGALELLAGIYRERKDLNLELDLFHMPFIADTFDEMSMPFEWLSFRENPRQMHLLSFSFLFEPATLVRYFRAINIAIMRKSHEKATVVYNDTRQYMWAPAIPIYGAKEVLSHLRPHMAKYFVLTIRRDDILNDAINQIWRRQRRELMRPLRVRLGKDEGEDGLDHGGVQQEFFRVVFGQAFSAEYGMFTVDPTTRMTWFQPGSFEPLYRFEALGILMSIAIYNGITLPITFPLAFYRKLLGLKVKKLDHIVDGWSDLAKGLKSLLEWSDGDVGDVIARTYEFSYELCGNTVTVDMQKIGRDDPWPPTRLHAGKKGKEKSKSTSFELPMEPALTPPSHASPNLDTAPALALSGTPSVEIKGLSTPLSIDSDLLEEAALVTNANREQYVKDYVFWLTHKSVQLQYEAFAKGFFTCLDRTALSIFNPESLKSVVEGHPEIDIDELERTATYDEYDKNSPTIINFWNVVRSFSPDQHRQLLEFVTASDRVPVNGISSIQFIVQKNGEEDHRLPSSSTCYGRLLLPQYSSRLVLEEKLTKAIENSVGFGTL